MTDQHVRPRSEPTVPEQRSAPEAPPPRHRAEIPMQYAPVEAVAPPVVEDPPERTAEPRRARQRRATRLALVVPLGLGALGVWAATASGISLLTTHNSTTTHSFTLAQSVAGMTRDAAQETAYADVVSGVRDNFELQFMGRLQQFVTGVYVNQTAGEGRPAGAVVFLGAAVNTKGDPEDFVRTFRSQEEAAGSTVTSVDVGAGALAACSQSEASPAVTTCAWSTGDSVGQLVPAVNGWDSAHLGAALAEFRSATEVSSTR